MYNKNNERYTKWSIRKVGVGVASVIVASGVFFFVGGADAHAAEVNNNQPMVMEMGANEMQANMEKPMEQPKENMEKPKEMVTPEVKPTESMNLKEEMVGTATNMDVKEAVAQKTKDVVNVPAKYLDKANFPGPFTAGVNQVIPYKFFAGDGMLTRLILKSSDTAPWSDNGMDKNAPLDPVGKSVDGKYFYEVSLDGVAKGKMDKELLDVLKKEGTQSYKATIKVYGEKEGKADLMNIVATKDLTVNLNGITPEKEVKEAIMNNVKDLVEVPVKYLDKANFPGPFTAGVNQVIPYEFFGGDGMLTRLILKSSDMAPWSDNGVAKNPALLPVEKLGAGQYFYTVELDGVAKGKMDKELLDTLKMAGVGSYTATIKVYGEKDGKVDLNNLVATKQVMVKINDPKMMQKGKMNHEMGQNMMHQKQNMMSEMMDKDSSMMQSNMDKQMMKDKMMLPKTNAATQTPLSVLLGALGTVLAFFGLRRKQGN